jgi:hypothetical protein
MVIVSALLLGGRLPALLLAFGFALGLALALPANLAASQTTPDASEVGTTVVVRNKVVGLLGEKQRDLAVGHRVYRDELIRTGARAEVELKLDDDTKLALGPDAELRLDEFAIGSGSNSSSIAVRLLKGTLRFLTGRQTSESYKIETPSATIGVRGTVFDVYISPQGDTFVLMHQGIVEVCSDDRAACRKHRSIGRILQVTKAGEVTEPGKWSPARNGGVPAAEAFPFVGRQLAIDRMRRMTHDTITERD